MQRPLSYRYRVLVQPDERTGTNEPAYTAYVPTLGIASDGDSESEALTNAQEAIYTYLDSLIEDGLPIPSQDTGSYRVKTAWVKFADGQIAANTRS